MKKRVLHISLTPKALFTKKNQLVHINYVEPVRGWKSSRQCANVCRRKTTCCSCGNWWSQFLLVSRQSLYSCWWVFLNPPGLSLLILHQASDFSQMLMIYFPFPSPPLWLATFTTMVVPTPVIRTWVSKLPILLALSSVSSFLVILPIALAGKGCTVWNW